MNITHFLLFTFLFTFLTGNQSALTNIITKLITDTITPNTTEPVDKKTDKIVEDTIDIFMENTTHIWNNFTYLFSDYQSYEDDILRDKLYTNNENFRHRCFSYYNRNAYEHMFSVCVKYNTKNEYYTLQIKDTKLKNGITKNLGRFDLREFIYQMPLFKEVLYNSIRYSAFWSKKKMNLNLFNDIKSELVKQLPSIVFEIGHNPIDNLDQPNFEYKLKNQDAYLGSISFNVQESNDPKYLNEISLEKNYMLNLSFKIGKDNQIQQGEISLAGITAEEETFKKFIKLIENAIDIKNQFNNFDGLAIMMTNYFYKNYSKIKIVNNELIGKDTMFPNQTFDLSYEYTNLEMSIGTSQGMDGTSNYIIMIDQKNNQFQHPMIYLNLKRTSEENLFKILDMQGGKKIIKKIKDDILEIFKEMYKEHQAVMVHELKQKDYGDLKSYADSHIMGTNYSGIMNKEYKCGFHEDNNSKNPQGFIIISSTSAESEFKFSFYMNKFNRNLIILIMRNFFDGIIELTGF